jgi:hypothetical protein
MTANTQSENPLNRSSLRCVSMPFILPYRRSHTRRLANLALSLPMLVLPENGRPVNHTVSPVSITAQMIQLVRKHGAISRVIWDP